MLGAVIGDVVGSRFEFHNIKSKKFLMFHPFCHITDDSVMTIAIAKSLCEYFGTFTDEIFENLCIKNMQQFGRKIRTIYGSMFYKWIWSDNPKPYNSFGNGAAMRVSPVAYFALDLKTCKLLARKVTAVTHNHPQALKAAECVACCVYLSIHDYDKEYIRNFVNENYYKLDFTLDEIRDTYTYQGDCDGTVPYAIECFLEGETFEDVIRNAISIGGDSDTIAAIAGSIAEPMMPYKYYKIAKHYCRKNLFLWRQFKYLECARIAELIVSDNGNEDEECYVDDNSSVKKYFKSVPEFKFVWKFMKKRKFIEWRIMITKLPMVKWNYLLNVKNDYIENEKPFEIAMLRKNRTGLPANIFTYDSDSWKRKFRENRIEFQNDTEDLPDIDNSIPMSIEDNPKILLSDGEIKTKVKLDKNQIDEIKKFVADNKDLLNALGNLEIDIGDFLEQMKMC